MRGRSYCSCCYQYPFGRALSERSCVQCVFCWHGKTKQFLFRTLGGETCPSRKHSLSTCGGSFPLVQPSLSVENTLRGGSSPAKERGCACAHEGSGLDAVATLTPGRERERETRITCQLQSVMARPLDSRSGTSGKIVPLIPHVQPTVEHPLTGGVRPVGLMKDRKASRRASTGGELLGGRPPGQGATRPPHP